MIVASILFKLVFNIHRISLILELEDNNRLKTAVLHLCTGVLYIRVNSLASAFMIPI